MRAYFPMLCSKAFFFSRQKRNVVLGILALTAVRAVIQPSRHSRVGPEIEDSTKKRSTHKAFAISYPPESLHPVIRGGGWEVVSTLRKVITQG